LRDLRDDTGASAIEYVLAMTLVALAAVGAWSMLGAQVDQQVDCAAQALGGAGSGEPCASLHARPRSLEPVAAVAPAAGERPSALTRARALVLARGSATAAQADWAARQLATLPESVLSALERQGTRVLVGNGSVVDAMPELAGARARGWMEGTSFADVHGIYDPRSGRVVVGLEGASGSRSELLHEIGHALDFGGGSRAYVSGLDGFRSAYAHTRFAAGHARYFAQSGRAGLEEAFAESFAMFTTDAARLHRQWPELYDYWAARGLGFEDAPRSRATAGAASDLAPRPSPWGWASDRASGIGGAVSSGWRAARDFNRRIDAPYRDFRDGFERGGRAAAWGAVAGIYGLGRALFTDPIGAARDFGGALVHPERIAGAAWHALTDYADTMWSGTWEERGHATGALAVDLALTVGATAGAGAVVKASKLPRALARIRRSPRRAAIVTPAPIAARHIVYALSDDAALERAIASKLTNSWSRRLGGWDISLDPYRPSLPYRTGTAVTRRGSFGRRVKIFENGDFRYAPNEWSTSPEP